MTSKFSSLVLASLFAFTALGVVVQPHVPSALDVVSGNQQEVLAAGASDFGAPGAPQWNTYVVPGGSGAGEPTVGIPWNGPGKDKVFFQDYADTKVATFDDSASPPTVVWRDITPAGSLINLDPMLHADQETGRVWAGGLLPGCSSMFFSDDVGATWTATTNMCSTVHFDHQSIGSGRWADLGKEAFEAVWPTATYYCAQYLGDSCSTSLDGGLTWLPQVEWLGACSGLHGHVRVSPITGTAVVPVRNCGSVNGYAISTNNGLTWDSRGMPYAPKANNGFDPSIDFSEDNGWMYFGMAGTQGAFIGLSKDEGDTWQDLGPDGVKWLDVGQFHDPPIIHAEFADVQSGDDDRVAMSFLGLVDKGTAYPDQHQCTNQQATMIWHYYVAMSYDAGATWTVQQVSEDPVQVGGISNGGTLGDSSCRNLLDFNDMDMDSTGRLVIGFADGCINQCAADETPGVAGYRQDFGTVIRQSTGRGLLAEYDVGAPPTLSPLVKIEDPVDDQVITTATMDVSGYVEYLDAGNVLVALPGGPYAGTPGAPFAISGGATGGTPPYACAWSGADAIFGDANACDTSLSYDVAGTYSLTLTITDSVAGSAAASIDVEIIDGVVPLPDGTISGGITIFPDGAPAAYNEIAAIGTAAAGDPAPKFAPATDVTLRSRFSVDSLDRVDKTVTQFTWVVMDPTGVPIKTANCVTQDDNGDFDCLGSVTLPEFEGRYYTSAYTDFGEGPVWITHNGAADPAFPGLKPLDIVADSPMMASASSTTDPGEPVSEALPGDVRLTLDGEALPFASLAVDATAGQALWSTTFDVSGLTGEQTIHAEWYDNTGALLDVDAVTFTVDLPGVPPPPPPTDDDFDDDGVLDVDDNCVEIPNSDQGDMDGDDIGDVCDPDKDGDTVANEGDNCPGTVNTNQADTNGDGHGDACVDDWDGDTILNAQDNCPVIANIEQDDHDNDLAGDVCDDDDDNDGIVDALDNCHFDYNPPRPGSSVQTDKDRDGIGDACDGDRDGDGVPDAFDAFPDDKDESRDTDRDGIGDNADLDDDGDGIPDKDESTLGWDALDFNGRYQVLDEAGDFAGPDKESPGLGVLLLAILVGLVALVRGSE